MTFPFTLECFEKSWATKHEIGSMVQKECWFSVEVREREGMSHIYVMLMTPAIRHTGSLCSVLVCVLIVYSLLMNMCCQCIESSVKLVFEAHMKTSQCSGYALRIRRVHSQSLWCLLKFTHLSLHWTYFALFAFSISSAAHSLVIHKSSIILPFFVL